MQGEQTQVVEVVDPNRTQIGSPVAAEATMAAMNRMLEALGRPDFAPGSEPDAI